MVKSLSARKLLLEQQQLLHRISRGPMLLSLGIAVFLCWYLRNSVEAAVLLSWLAVFSLISIGRLWLAFLANSAGRKADRRKQHNLLFLCGVWLAAFTWAMASILFFPEANPAEQPVFTIIIVGISAGAISALCSSWAAISGFLTLSLLPLAARLLTVNEQSGNIIGVLVILFWLVSLSGAHKLHKSITGNISLRLKSAENEHDLKIGQERYLHIFNHSPLGVFLYDSSGTIIDCNKVFSKAIDMPMTTAIGKNIFSILKNEELKRAIRDSLETGDGYFEGEYVTRENGPKSPVRIYLKATRSTDDMIKGGIGTLEDFSERRLFEQTIEHQASYDALTGLPNRELLMKLLDQELSRATRHNQIGALLFIDLDNFKTVNNALGHKAGDVLLKHVSLRLTSNHRKEDITSRMGGDEFVILLPDLDSDIEKAAEKSLVIAKKLSNIMAAPLYIEEQELSVTLSIGVSLFPEQDKNAGDILKQANTAMNQAKIAGRNVVQFFQPSMQQAADKRLRMNNDIKKAIENDELALHFQPQVKLDGTIVGAEGLLRWTHPERGMIPPLDFISVAEETGIIVEIGSWVLRRICETVKEWEDSHLLTDSQTIAVNISPREFSTPDFVERVVSTIEETGVNPRHLDIELTEGSLISSVSDTIKKIQALRDYGIKFSVDDFGTGYSSLSYLKSLPLHTLKIDRSFVNDIQPGSDGVMLVEVIITMAHKLGLEIVAEGVESLDQLNYLASEGCNVFQGYYFCKPIPTPEFRKLLESGTVNV
jgi:diguanylate cyclase (GGDEF)-like protein/PAS domain S-box-containing protein